MSYPLETWERARHEYEIGTCKSLLEVSKKYGMSETILKKRASAEAWIKNYDQSPVRLSVQQRFAEEIEKQIGVDKIVQKLNALLEATDSLIIDGKELGTVKNWNAIANGIRECNKILGAYAPVKSEVDVSLKMTQYTDKIIGALQKSLPEDMQSVAIDAIVEDIGAMD